MATKNENYSREFTSRTEHYESGNHESSEFVPYQTINEEDEKLREKIIKNYALSRNRVGLKDLCYGFDGKMQYNFSIQSKLPEELQGNTKKTGKYTTTIEIRKEGDKKNINQNSDLEKFLLSNDFEKNK